MKVKLDQRMKNPNREEDKVAGEQITFCNLGSPHHGLGNFKTAIDNHERDLGIAKEIGDRAGEGKAYGNIGNAHYGLGEFQKSHE